jgi:polysaccharide deacetylase family protein (PEP-CTERM system associated)
MSSPTDVAHTVGSRHARAPNSNSTRPRFHGTSFVNAFTVDVEDYYHVDAFSHRIDPATWHTFESRVVQNTQRILRLLGEAGALGTFFVLGHVAQQHPELVRAIQRDGHEIGCHGFWHRPIYRLTPEQFREDLRLATDVLTDITGSPLTAFRAPNFSVRQDTLWALDILSEAGYEVDSSIFPVRHDQYGIPYAERAPHRRELTNGTIWEYPPTVYSSGLGNVPIAGGGYFRLLPFRLTRFLMQRVLTSARRPLMFYIHPWEVDIDQPRIPCSWKSRFRHYQNLRTTERKLSSLLRAFPFGTMTQSLHSAGVGFESEEGLLLAERTGLQPANVLPRAD